MKHFSQLTDEELANEYVKGNNRAFDALLERTQTTLFTYILYFVHDEETANDIFQETFLKVIVRLKNHQYVSSGKFSYWLMRIAHNAIMDWFRRQRTHGVDSTDNIDTLPKSGMGELPLDITIEDVLAREKMYNDVKSLISFLPENQREVLMMRYYDNYSFKEIADITGVSINTSLGRMRYALKNMRKIAKMHNIALSM